MPPAAHPLPPMQPQSSRAGRLAALLSLLLLLAGLAAAPAHAQITKEKPGRIRAANRRALREAREIDSPYKDSHLDVTRERLRRGGSTEPQPNASRDTEYATGTAPNVKPPSLLGIRRRTAIQQPPAHEVKKPKEKKK